MQCNSKSSKKLWRFRRTASQDGTGIAPSTGAGEVLALAGYRSNVKPLKVEHGAACFLRRPSTEIFALVGPLREKAISGHLLREGKLPCRGVRTVCSIFF